MSHEDEVEMVLDSALRSDTLWYESLSQKRRRPRRERELRRAGDPEARFSRRAVIAGSFKAALANAVERLVRDELEKDDRWTWCEVPLDTQITTLRDLFLKVGYQERFRWDVRHDFPVW